MPRWYEAHDRLQAATNMILGLRHAPARYVENNLRTAVETADVLHRSLRIDEKPFPRADFKAMRDAMLEQVPEERRATFKGAIRNDPTAHRGLFHYVQLINVLQSQFRNRSRQSWQRYKPPRMTRQVPLPQLHERHNVSQ